MVVQAYRPRKPKASPLWQCVNRYFDAFLALYPDKYEPKLGFLRPIITKVVHKFLDCGDLELGFARVRCPDCGHEYLLAFSCKGRWFCPSCHQKKVLLFGEFVIETLVFPVPHRHYVLTIPRMLRPYFQFHRDLLKELCLIAHETLRDFMRTALDLREGIPGIVMAIHTFGEFAAFHPHLHALVADGLFTEKGVFYVLPEGSIKPVEDLFRQRLIAHLVARGVLPEERARMLLNWHHSGFDTYHSRRIQPDDKANLERVAQYIIRNPFSQEKMELDPASGMVTYRDKPNIRHRHDREFFAPVDFIATITQHIPDQGAQMLRYYGWYSNKSRGLRAKRSAVATALPASLGGSAVASSAVSCGTMPIIEIADYQPRRGASKKWRELIKKVWEVDPLICPFCQSEMKIISLIDDQAVIARILKHLGLGRRANRPAARLCSCRPPALMAGPSMLGPRRFPTLCRITTRNRLLRRGRALRRRSGQAGAGQVTWRIPCPITTPNSWFLPNSLVRHSPGLPCRQPDFTVNPPSPSPSPSSRPAISGFPAGPPRIAS